LQFLFFYIFETYRTPGRMQPSCVRETFCLTGDYLQFLLNGIPVARPADFDDRFPPWTHSEYDTPSRISISDIVENEKVFSSLLYHLMTMDHIPSSRLTENQVRSFSKKMRVDDIIEWRFPGALNRTYQKNNKE